MPNHSHLIFTNNQVSGGQIPTQRGGGRNNEKKVEENEIEIDYTAQKEIFRKNLQEFNNNRIARNEKRTLPELHHYDFIKIDFFKMYSNGLYNRYGIKPLTYYSNNMSALFQITNNRLFSTFLAAIDRYSSSEGIGIPEKLKELSLIDEFSLLTSEQIQQTATSSTMTLNLLPLQGEPEYDKIYRQFEQYIAQHDGLLKSVEKIRNIYELRINANCVTEILDNFDIIQKVQALPTMHVSPSAFRLANFRGDFKINRSKDEINNLPIIGIIDSGVRHIGAYTNLIVGESSICPGPYQIVLDHATHVASLIIYGMQNILEDEIKPQAKIYSIQAIRNNDDKVSLFELKKKIIQSHKEYGIRIYNISMSSPLSKDINADISDYARMLDYLSSEYDILFVISTGNFDDYTEEYPYHFYNPANPNYTQNTNLGEPADCMNGISVGAIADCLRGSRAHDKTPSNVLPAYYSKKGFRDYSVKVNNAYLGTHQVNWNLSKPDIVMSGGDCNQADNGLTVFGPERYAYVEHVSGTSFATPLTTNIIAQLLHLYPQIQTQELKALLINSCQNTPLKTMEQFAQIITRRKSVLQTDRHFKPNRNSLNDKRLQKMIEGYGVPEINDCLYSQDNKVTFVANSSISHNTFNIHHFKLPPFLKTLKRAGKILRIKGTLCFATPAMIANNPLMYNPYHVSFRFMNAQETEQQSIATIERRTEEDSTDKVGRKQASSIRNSQTTSTIDKWSEDFDYYNLYFFSNTQKKEDIVKIQDLEKVNDEIAVAFRCLAKEGVRNTAINYAFVLTVQLEGIEEPQNYSLYAELKQLNNSIDLNNSIEQQLEEDIEADLHN